MEKEFVQRGKVIFEGTEATQHDESGATTDRERTNTSHTGRVESAAGSDPGSGAAADGDRTGWETEREAFLASEAAPAGTSAESVVDDAPDLGSIVGDVVQLGYNMERLQSAAPMTPLHSHGEHKQLAKERQKKIAQGHAEDDHEDEQNKKYQQTM